MNEKSAALQRFMDSTLMTYERWHDGIGYDLDALSQMTAGERAEIEHWLLTRDPKDWRDLEALSVLGSDTAKAHLREQLKTGSIELRLAAAGELADDAACAADREQAIIDGIAHAPSMGGLSRALDLAAEFKSPAVIEALLRATLAREPEASVNAAGLIYYLFGKTNEAFDWSRRPFFLRFGEDARERRAAFSEMCAELGVDPAKYL